METKKRNNIIVTTTFLLLISCIVFLAYSDLKSSLKGSSKGNLIGKGIRSAGPVKMKTGLNNRFYYENKQVYLNIDLKADKVEAKRERTPLNLAVVIDRSGSMDEKNKLTYVKKAVENIIDNLDEGDYVSLVAYNDEVTVLQKTTQVESRYLLKEKVNKLNAAGFTNLSGGMLEGFDQVSRSYKKGYVNRVLLLSDGLANRGITDRFKLAEKVRDINKEGGIVISTFGVGNDFNEDLMTDLAEYGKGNYYYIRDAEQIPDIFAHELSGVRMLVAQNTKVTVRFPDNYLSLNRVFGYPYEVHGDEVTIDFKDVFSEQNKTVLLKFNVIRPVSSRLEFDCELRYNDVTNNFLTMSETEHCSINAAVSKAEYEKGYDEKVQQSVALFETNDLMEQALREADLGNYEKAKEKMQTGRAYMDEQMSNIAPSPEMKRQVETMDRYDKDLKSAETKTEEERKEMQKSGKYDNYNTRKNN